MATWDFDGDEVLFFLIAGIIGVIRLFFWFMPLMQRMPLRPAPAIRFSLAAAPIAALGGLWFVLTHWADPKYVVNHIDYQLLFVAGGLAWFGLLPWLAQYLGISYIDDALERSNPAAAAVLCGAVLGLMAIYAGGNVGSGPTIWTTIWPAFLGTFAWLWIWFFVEQIAHPSEAIALDRDLASGIRMAGFLIASGLTIGRSAAGDWTSWAETHGSMVALGWPALAWAIAAIGLQILYRPTPQNPQPNPLTRGFIPAIVMIALAIGYLVMLGPADIGKHVITYEEYMKSR